MILPLRLTWLGLLSLCASTALFAQQLPADGTAQLRQLPTAAARRPLPLDSRQLLRQELALRPADDMRPLRTETDALGQRHERFQQYYKGVKVEHGVYTVHRAAGVLSGEFKLVPTSLTTKPTLSAAAALQRGLTVVGASRYMWQDAAAEASLKQLANNPNATYQPTGELVLVEDFRVATAAARPLVLAWKFDIYAQQPLSRAWVYVDARNGEVVLRDAIIKHAGELKARPKATTRPTTARQPTRLAGTTSAATGTFATRYSGTQTAATDLLGGTHRLRDYTRAAGIETYNMQRTTNTIVDFTDVDNSWTAAEYNNANKDNAALDAHYASQKVFDYWLTVHGRNSYDDQGSKLLNLVHYSTNYDNAFWNGTLMVYGDGNTAFTPLTSLDVCAHETGHGICQETAGLVYQNESGALNEGFSDIWGAAIENHVDPSKQTWVMGEEICRWSAGMRSMSNPLNTSMMTVCPANYRGQRWHFGTSDYGGVHTNSGVLNHWFYILSAGKTGVNELQQAYSVAGIGIASAARIAYRAERLYLTPNSDYRSARMFTIQAATDLFGATSPEVAAVTDAWYAVGLGNASTAPAGTVAQCPTDDAALLTATASSATICSGETLTLTATAAFPATRRLRTAAATALPDGAAGFTSLPLYTIGGSAQHGLEYLYRNYASLTGVRVRLTHPQPAQVALRLAVRDVSGVMRYVSLATALPTYNGSGAATLDITFAANAGTALPATLSGNSLTGAFQPATALSSIAPGTLLGINVEAQDGQVGSAGTIELAELLFTRAASDAPLVRWTGPAVDATSLTVQTNPTAPAGGGTTTKRYTVLASDPYFGCTSSQEVTVTVRQPRLVAAASITELCAGPGQAFSPINLQVTADDSLAGQTYQWSGPAGYAATGKRRTTQPASGGRLAYTVQTATPGFTCTSQQQVVVLARRPVAAVPAGIDSLLCAGSLASLLSRPLENQLNGPFRFTGSQAIPDNNAAGVRIPLQITGSPEGFFELRGVQLSLTHTWMGDLEIYVEAPDGTRVLLSGMNGADGQSYQNTLFVDSVGVRTLGAGAAPYAGTWRVDDPAGFAALRQAAQVGTWHLWVRDLGPWDTGTVTAWALVTKANTVTWSGPNGFTARGPLVSTPVLTTPGRYLYRATTQSGGCTFQEDLTVRVTAGSEWRFRQNADLALAANWNCPANPATNVIVQGTTAGQPQLTGGLLQVHDMVLPAGTVLTLNGGTLEVHGTLTIPAGSTLVLGGGNLEVKGNWINNGTLQATDGTVTLSGTAPQQLGGSSLNAFWNLNVGGAGAVLSGPTAVQRLLTLSANLNLSGQTFTLRSDAAGTAMVVNSGGEVQGTATMQRYIDPTYNSGAGYRHYASPVQAATVAGLAAAGFAPVLNTAYNTAAVPGSVAPFPNVFAYQESRLTAARPGFDAGWESPASAADLLQSGRGYTVNIGASSTVALRGTLNNGPVTVTGLTTGNTAESGWQLLGNPYPAPINWDNLPRPAGMFDAVYLFHSLGAYSGSYDSYVNGIGTNHFQGLLPAMQGFFVRTSTAVPAFTFTNAARLTSYTNPTFYRNGPDLRPLVQLEVVSSQGQRDAAIVYFEQGATAGFDGRYDATKLSSAGRPYLAALAGSEPLSISGLPVFGGAEVTVPLRVQVPATGTYTLTAARLLRLPSTMRPYLRDAQTGTLTDLTQQPAYTFTMNAGFTGPRFSLVFSPQAALATASGALTQQVVVYPNPAHAAVQVELPAALSAAPVTAELLDALGRVVSHQLLPIGVRTHHLSLTEVATGVYTLRLQAAAGVVTKRLVVE